MLVNVDAGTVSLFSPDGELLTLPYEALDERAMSLQAQYHLFLRHHRYRRELVCRRCRSKMDADTSIDEELQTWAMLARCACRALHGVIEIARVPMSAAKAESSIEKISPDEVATVLAYETRFLAGLAIAEKLYCDACFAVGSHDGCRVSVTQSGLSGIVHIHCRCRTLEHKGLVH